MKAIWLCHILCCVVSAHLAARVILVGPEEAFPNLEPAAAQAQAGDTILFRNGRYAGDQRIVHLQGQAGQEIVVLAESCGGVVISGGQVAWHFTDAAYLHIAGFIFEEQTVNGLNVDDGQDYSSPSHHLTFENCQFRNIRADGNNDLLKLSGLDHFHILHCRFENGAAKGSGIDMVGCHEGLISNSHFENLGSNSLQIKGGSARIKVLQNFFRNGGIRTLNLGGSTGMPFFRPLDATWEATEIEVYANIIIGSGAAVAYVGATQVTVANNTIINPQDWVLRILQETVAPQRFVACGDNFFQNNLIYYGAVRTEVNTGAHTRPESFTFSGNLWYCRTDPKRVPVLPLADPTMISGQDPRFADLGKEDFRLQAQSPAKGQIHHHPFPATDFHGKPYADPRAIGACEFQSPQE